MALDGYDKLSDNTKLSFVVVSFEEKTPARLTLKYLNVIAPFYLESFHYSANWVCKCQGLSTPSAIHIYCKMISTDKNTVKFCIFVSVISVCLFTCVCMKT